MEELVKAARTGDAVAWNSLFNHHFPWMYATALHICGNNAAAKDAVQETFVNAYLKLHQLRDVSAFPGWLKKGLTRHCFRTMRDAHLHNAASLSSIGQSPRWNDEINTDIDSYGQQARIYRALACLPDTLQSVLLLRYFSIYNSYEQIAIVLCIPVGTVRSRLNQARKKLVTSWQQSSGDNDTALREVQEWNGLYHTWFGHVYTSSQDRERLIEHFDKNLQLVFSSGKSACGRKVVEQQIEEDLLYGNRFTDLQVMTSGNLSIVEARNINSPDYPNRCPAGTVFVLRRTGDKTTWLRLHHSC